MLTRQQLPFRLQLLAMRAVIRWCFNFFETSFTLQLPATSTNQLPTSWGILFFFSSNQSVTGAKCACVFFTGGKCILHTKRHRDEDEGADSPAEHHLPSDTVGKSSGRCVFDPAIKSIRIRSLCPAVSVFLMVYFTLRNTRLCPSYC